MRRRVSPPFLWLVSPRSSNPARPATAPGAAPAPRRTLDLEARLSAADARLDDESGQCARDRDSGAWERHGRRRGWGALGLAALLSAGCYGPRTSIQAVAARDPAGAEPVHHALAAAASASVDEHDPSRLAWVDTLARQIAAIDRRTEGNVGVYIKHLASGAEVAYEAARAWYMSSTIKVPVAIAVLQLVEEGQLSLDDTLVLKQSDFVDGTGDILRQAPGKRYTLGTLVEKSLVHSDSTATDMLIRRIGADELNRRVQSWVPDGFGRLTTILDVRYLAYSELHPNVANLSNMDLVRLKRAGAGKPRIRALCAALGVREDQLAFSSIEEAFERYYESGLNSASLEAFARLLERLVEGELLNAEHTELLLGHMLRITTGARRIAAGLPASAKFAQKTGTQVARACNVGILDPQDPGRATIVAACVERYRVLADAERAFRELGRALAEADPP